MLSRFKVGQVVTSTSEAQTRELGGTLAEVLAPDGLLLLFGDMGMGKTVLVKGMAERFGIDPARVQSPTFTLMNEYSISGILGAQRLVHVDLYRLETGDVESSGVLEALGDPAAVKVVEWSERMPFEPEDAFRVRIEADSETERLFTLF